MIDKHFFSRLSYWVHANLDAWLEIRQQSAWLRRARLAQGLKGVEMARRLGVSPARVSMMESDEEKGAVTIKMMQRAAQALDCEFVYLLVPKNAFRDEVAQASNKPKMRIRPQSSQD